VGRPPASAQLGVLLTGILELPERIAALEGEAAARAARLLDVRRIHGSTVPPPELEPWLEATFGSLEAVREQSVLKVANRATLEGTLFAPLRARRPIDGDAPDGDLASVVRATTGDLFCHPETGTPAEPTGRVRGARVVTGANAALADGHHAVLVFDTHDPLAFDAELIADIVATGRAWADRTHRLDPDASAYLLLWNCLWRAGGSIVHGHAQALLGAGPHYAAIERFARDAARYYEAHASDLVADLVALHRDLGLAIEGDEGVVILAHVTPVKERELLVVGQPGMDERDPAFVAAIVTALAGFRDRLGVRSFNAALWRAPLDPAVESWERIPPIVRLVDRGDPFQRASDIGAMELYGTPIVGSDPYEVVDTLG
jgi:hypothetical protein